MDIKLQNLQKRKDERIKRGPEYHMQLKKFREKVDAEHEREEYIKKLELNAQRFMPKLMEPSIPKFSVKKLPPKKEDDINLDKLKQVDKMIERQMAQEDKQMRALTNLVGTQRRKNEKFDKFKSAYIKSEDDDDVHKYSSSPTSGYETSDNERLARAQELQLALSQCELR